MSVVSENLRQALNRLPETVHKQIIVVAVSGGPDSLTLLHALHALQPNYRYTLHVAHFDHGLRPESADEATFVGQAAQRLGLAITTERQEIAALAQEQHANLHLVAREERYRFLARTARALHARFVATAHTANDQAESVLMHLLRGSGLAGLRGIQPALSWQEWMPEMDVADGPWLIRPLLATPRLSIENYCQTHQLEPRLDSSNQDLAYTRSRIRYELLPLLQQYNPRIIDVLGHTAASAADDYRLVEAALDAIWPSLVHIRPDGVDLYRDLWHTLSPALQRHALRRAYRLLQPDATLTWERVEMARAATSGAARKQIELPGNLALTIGNHHFTLGTPAPVSAPQLPTDSAPLDIPGQISLADGWEIIADRKPLPPPTHWLIRLRESSLTAPLIVRRRQPGDHIQLDGVPRSLQNLFVNAKIPQRLRAAWPILTCQGTIVWLPGLRIADGFAADETTSRAVEIMCRVISVPQPEIA